MLGDSILHMLGESKMVLGQAEYGRGRIIMVGMRQRPDVINAKNLVKK